MQCSALEWRFLLPPLNRCCCIHLARHISFHNCFSCSSFPFCCRCWMNLKTSVSSRVAYLDCLLAQWMEVSISVRRAGFTEQTRNSKSRFMAFHCTKRSSQLLDMHCLGWILKTKDTTVVSSSPTVWCTKYWLNIQPWVLIETVDNPSCHVCSKCDV